MTKQELIDAMAHLDNDEEIFVAVQTNNYWRMVAIKSIKEMDEKLVRYSSNLESLVEVDQDEEKFDDTEYVYTLKLK